MAEATTLALVAQGASSVLGGMSSMSAARSERDQANRNAFIGETRAQQTAAEIMATAAEEMSTMRATMAANGQTGGAEFWREAFRNRRRDARISVQNERDTAEGYRAQGRVAMARGRADMIRGFAGAVDPAYGLYQHYKGPS